MSDLCEHETFKDICGICHRNSVIDKQAAEINTLCADNERLRADLEAADIAVSRLNGRAELQKLMRENNKLRACLVDIATGQVVELPFIQALARAALAQEKQG